MFAKLYDILMADVDYEALFKWLEPFLSKDDFIVDAGCGSGYMLYELLNKGYHAIGFDKDSEMLALAANKLKENNLPINLYEHDLRDYIKIEADVIIAFFDVVNYFKGLKGVFYNIYHMLSEHGMFVFDMYKETQVQDYEESDIDPLRYHWKVNVKKNMIHHELLIENQSVKIKQYIHPLENILNILNKLGFQVEVTDGIDQRKYYVIAHK
jgi:SAM-dependent methyltransferase